MRIGPLLLAGTVLLLAGLFHDLVTGRHRIEVVLADSEHKPLGPSQILEVTIPARMVEAH